MFFNDKYLLVFISVLVLISLTGCASQYAPLTSTSKHAGGYKERLLNKASVIGIVDDKANINEQNKSSQLTPARFFLTYQGTTRDTKERITGYWHQRASELCLKGFKVERHHQSLVQGTLETPVNGRMEKLVTFQPIDSGIIQCLE